MIPSPYQLGFDPEAVVEKLEFYGDLSRETYPARIAAGFTDVPFLFVGGRNDWFCNHDLPAIPEALAEGIDHNCDYYHHGISQVIAAQPNSHTSWPISRTGVTYLPLMQTGQHHRRYLYQRCPRWRPWRSVSRDSRRQNDDGPQFFRPTADEMPYHFVRAGIEGKLSRLNCGWRIWHPLSYGTMRSIAPMYRRCWIRGCRRIRYDLLRLDADARRRTGAGFRGLSILSLEGWQTWFDYALARHNTGSAIGMPWIDYPTDYADAETYADIWDLFYSTKLLPAVDDLRALYPTVTIYSIPYGRAVNG